jgi:hypothetical protein
MLIPYVRLHTWRYAHFGNMNGAGSEWISTRNTLKMLTGRMTAQKNVYSGSLSGFGYLYNSGPKT